MKRPARRVRGWRSRGKRRHAREGGGGKKLQPWTLHDYTIKSYIQSKRVKEREKPARSKRKVQEGRGEKGARVQKDRRSCTDEGDGEQKEEEEREGRRGSGGLLSAGPGYGNLRAVKCPSKRDERGRLLASSTAALCDPCHRTRGYRATFETPYRNSIPAICVIIDDRAHDVYFAVRGNLLHSSFHNRATLSLATAPILTETIELINARLDYACVFAIVLRNRDTLSTNKSGKKNLPKNLRQDKAFKNTVVELMASSHRAKRKKGAVN
ncbi:hypothetical protein PUN28_007103 [Cardiocondyla obscurior]|uniref:Uncharacterized protein n=1 Tax=Cardiocondyla obscurior TaxID=286306 RepID=A0AAW2G6L7_9HYME